MAYVPGFRYDLFVSYAGIDNAGGWVEHFAKALTVELQPFLGNFPLFFDKWAIGTGQSYPKERDAAAEDSAMLVAIVSPAYLGSARCTQDRAAFQRRLPPNAAFSDCLIRDWVEPEWSGTSISVSGVPGSYLPFSVFRFPFTEGVAGDTSPAPLVQSTPQTKRTRRPGIPAPDWPSHHCYPKIRDRLISGAHGNVPACTGKPRPGDGSAHPGSP